MGRDGGDVERLTDDRRFDSWWARLSPDRRLILFYRSPKGTHDRDYTKTSLWMMASDGSGPVELRPARTDGWRLQGHAEWSPDGGRLVMFGGPRLNPRIHLTGTNGREPQTVVRRGGSNLDPSWSPDGTRILFVGCPRPICVERDYEIYTADAQGGGERRLTDDSLRDHDPYFSPDGSRVAWLTQTSRRGAVGVWNIRMAGADGSNLHLVTNDNAVNSKPEWARDGSVIYFHRIPPGERRFGIYLIRPDGTGLTEITAGHPGVNEYPSL